VARRSGAAWLVVAGFLAAGCGGGEDTLPAVTPAQEPGEAVADVGAAAAQNAASQEEQGERTQLVREVFSYRGAGRDPFVSLVKSGDVRPLLGDLRVTSINYNERYPSNSVAVLRDTSAACVQSPAGGCRYTVQAGDVLGRLTVALIRRFEVVIVFEEFGEERQQVLRLRRSQEETR
jgi:hypothetical protein